MPKFPGNTRKAQRGVRLFMLSIVPIIIGAILMTIYLALGYGR